MLRKIRITILSSIALLFFVTVPAFAREMKLDELGKEVLERVPETNYVYIIGKYAYTSRWELTTQDVMLAARSIVEEDADGEINTTPIYKKMSVFKITPKTEIKGGKIVVSGWNKVGDTLGGGKILGDTVDIRYIDYKYIKGTCTVTLNTDGGNSGYKSSITVEEGGKIDKKLITGENTPTKEGKQFKGWVKEENGIASDKAWDFDKDTVNSNITLKATWYDELNTDKLLEEAAGKMVSTDYGATFANKILTYNIYDTNKKNSEIKGTGLVGTIRDIIKEENVDSIVISYNGQQFTFNNSEMSGDNESEAYKKLKEVLEKMAGDGKTFENMVQGDLVGKELKLVIKLNEQTARSHNNKIEEEYEIRFVYNPLATIGTEIPDQDKKDLKDIFNYTTEDTYSISGENGLYTVAGSVTEQEKIKGFGEEEKNGFYFAYTITLNDGVDSTKVKVKIPVKDNPEANEYNEADFLDGTDKITVLMEVEEKETTKYRDIIIEIDGVPTKIRIDFSQLELKKSSRFEVKTLPEEDKDKFTDGGWYDTENGYFAEIEQDEQDARKYKVKGVLPIVNDDNGKYGETFDTKKNLYYLGLLLKLSNANNIKTEDTSKISVKFSRGKEDDNQYIKVYGNDSDSSNELYILKALTETTKGEEKTFNITLDFDGNDEEYSPYTVTVDWTELMLQSTSNGNFDNCDVVISQDSIAEDEEAVEQLKTFGYNYETSKEVKLSTTEDTTKKCITGKIKEQTLKEGFSNNNGYFVPIKVEFPGKDIDSLKKYSNTWTLILNTEDGGTKEYKPSDEEYQQGWVLVLFKIEENGKDGVKTIKYKIDFDGTPNKDGNSGYAYLPQEYSIEYDSLVFQTENKITYKYKESTGTEQSVEEVVYEGDETTLKDLGMDTDYRKFNGWYKDETNRVGDAKNNTITTKENEDLTLTAHWGLDVETFIDGVITDLNNAEDTTYSNDFSGKFHLESNKDNKNEITINLDGANVPLTELAETSIPGTIAYVLEKGNIEDITLRVGSQDPITFNSDYKASGNKTYDETSSRKLLDDEGIALKKEIIKGAKDAFDKELNSNEDKATLDQLEYNDKKFTLEIGDTTDNTVKLVDPNGKDLPEDKKTYTFKFVSDFAVVKVDNNSGLGTNKIEDAIGNSKDYSTVYIDGNYTAEKTININADHKASIEPVDNASAEKVISETESTTTISVTGEDNNYVFNVQSGTVKISDLKLTGGKEAELKVEDGATVTVNNVDVSGIELKNFSKDEKVFQAGIIVEGGSLTASKLKNEDEIYDIPTIRIPNGNEKNKVKGTVKLLDNSEMTSNNTYYRVNKVEADFDESIMVYDSCYYLNKDNAEIYAIMFIDPLIRKNGYVFSMTKFYYHGQKISTDELEKFRETCEYKNETLLKEYEFKGWYAKSIGLGTVPEGDSVNFDNETLKSGTTYFAAYKKKSEKTLDAQDGEGSSINEDNN